LDTVSTLDGTHDDGGIGAMACGGAGLAAMGAMKLMGKSSVSSVITSLLMVANPGKTPEFWSNFRC
jgi:hypothetical protein